jgi:hypothetical protein
MVVQDIYDPLSEYVNVFQDRFRAVTEETFAELAKDAHVDVEANRQTCQRIYAAQKEHDGAAAGVRRWTWLCAALWLCTVGIGGGIWYAYSEDVQSLELAAVGSVIIVLIAVFGITKVLPRLRELKDARDKLKDQIAQLKKEAWEQMAPLNRLYDWDVLTRMMTKTVPRLEFDPYFTTQRLADLKEVYDWDESFNDERSVLYAHSGLINGNPFVICRTRKMEWGARVYTGTKTIYWEEEELDDEGNLRTQEYSQVLEATVTAQYPEYYEKTRLIYGNTAAPDLIFNRRQSDLASKEGTFSYKVEKHALRKKARDLRGSDFAMMTNEEFEVAFNTSDRNSNQQFALLFTPLAQESMLKLLKNRTAGYGDDFDFLKHKMINTIIPDHLQTLDLETNPKQYHNFDYDKAQQDFYTINAQYFRAIYFSLAPLLCIPMYQQIRSHEDIYGQKKKKKKQRRSAYWEHEALANFWGEDRFKHPDCVTQCILKTEQYRSGKDTSIIVVSAHGYSVVTQLTYVEVWGDDGNCHDVPVYWDEYLPITGVGHINIREDDTEDASFTQSQRLEHISSVLNEEKYEVYRRHIASKVV